MKEVQSTKFMGQKEEHQMQWNTEQSLVYHGIISELPSINFKVSLWKDTKSSPYSKKHDGLLLRGEFFLFLMKLLNEGETKSQGKKIVKEITIEKKVQLNGLHQGKATIDIEIEHDFYFSQKVAGIMSEVGLIMQSPIIYHRKEKDHPKIL